MSIRWKIATWLAGRDSVVVPRDPSPAMIRAACRAMSPARRPTEQWVSVREKHTIRYRAMIDAACTK